MPICGRLLRNRCKGSTPGGQHDPEKTLKPLMGGQVLIADGASPSLILQ